LDIEVTMVAQYHYFVAQLQALKCLSQLYVLEMSTYPVHVHFSCYPLTCSSIMFYLHKWIFIQRI